MKSCAIITALAAVALAAPAKRDIVWVTETAVATKYVDVTETVWVDAATMTSTASPSPAPASAQRKNKQVSTVLTTYAQPTPSTSTSKTSTSPSVYVAPTTAAPSTTPSTTTVAAPTTPASTYVAPSPSTSAAPAPSSTTPASVAAPAYSSPAASAPASSGGDGGCDAYSPGASCSGTKFSYYTAGMGSCGIQSTDSDYIFAYPAAMFAAKTPNGNPNNNPLCGKKISITAYDGSKITATLVDSCPGCASGEHLDLTPALWDRVSKGDPNADGICTGYEWEWQ